MNLRRLLASPIHAAKLHKLVLECDILDAKMSMLVQPCLGQLVGITGEILADIAFSESRITLLTIPHTASLDHVGVLLMVGNRQGLLCELDLEALAYNVLARKGLVGTVFYPMHKRRFLLELSNGCVALCKGGLIRTGLGYQDVAVPGYKLLLLLPAAA